MLLYLVSKKSPQSHRRMKVSRTYLGPGGELSKGWVYRPTNVERVPRESVTVQGTVDGTTDQGVRPRVLDGGLEPPVAVGGLVETRVVKG